MVLSERVSRDGSFLDQPIRCPSLGDLDLPTTSTPRLFLCNYLDVDDCHTLTAFQCKSTQPPTNQSINQPTNQSTNQPINQPTNQPTNPPINQSINRSINQSTNQPINQSVTSSQPTPQRLFLPRFQVQKTLAFINNIISGPPDLNKIMEDDDHDNDDPTGLLRFGNDPASLVLPLILT